MFSVSAMLYVPGPLQLVCGCCRLVFVTLTGQQSNRFDLYGSAGWECSHLDGGAGRVIAGEKGGIHFVHQSKFTHILQENRRFNHLVHAAAGSFKDSTYVCEGLFGLCLDTAFNDFAYCRVNAHLAGGKHQHASGHTYRIRAKGFWRFFSGYRFLFVMATRHSEHTPFLIKVMYIFQLDYNIPKLTRAKLWRLGSFLPG
jgi:hypothetical protein